MLKEIMDQIQIFFTYFNLNFYIFTLTSEVCYSDSNKCFVPSDGKSLWEMDARVLSEKSNDVRPKTEILMSEKVLLAVIVAKTWKLCGPYKLYIHSK